MAAEEKFEELGKESGQKRNAARTEERFPVEYRIISEGELLSLQKSFIEMRTAEREESVGGGDDAFGDQFTLAGATQAQLQMFQQTMRAIRMLDQKLEDVLEAMGKKDSSKTKMTKAMCVDLSAGGMRVITSQKLELGVFVRVLIPLPPLHPVTVSALGKVVKSNEVKLASGRPACEAAFHFEAINEQDRDDIVAYSFKRQRQEAYRAPVGEGEDEEEA